MSVVQPEGNYYNKYESKNPIARALMKGFFQSIEDCLKEISFQNVYEAGCGEGYVTEFISKMRPDASIQASDISEKTVQEARKRVPQADFQVGSIYEIPFANNTFDLVIASEVLEHLEAPEKALQEVLRVSQRYVLISVPNEPIWRVSNMLRGKYLSHLGNTPGHIQHWSKSAFSRMLEKHCSVLQLASPFPWTMALCKKQ